VHSDGKRRNIGYAKPCDQYTSDQYIHKHIWTKWHDS